MENLKKNNYLIILILHIPSTLSQLLQYAVIQGKYNTVRGIQGQGQMRQKGVVSNLELTGDGE
jgi:hypothetical protein